MANETERPEPQPAPSNTVSSIPPPAPSNTVSSIPPEAARRFNYSRYATKKTVSQGLLDVALLMSNASQLKAIMDVGTNHSYYHVVFGIIIFSIVLQIVTAIMLLILGTTKDETDEQKKKMNYLNNVIIVLILLITVSNVFITAFGVQFEDSKKTV